jgi:protein tyrosine phosphatase (PTP) superfamily phosphohydrolase (DUF442 family)
LPPTGSTFTPPPGSTFTPPPGSTFTPPAGSTFTPPPGSSVYPSAPPAPAPITPPTGTRFYPPSEPTPSESRWQGVPQAGVQLSPLPPSSPEPPRDGVRLQTPQPGRPAITEERTATPSLPVDIPQFAVAQDRVTNGLKPFPDGFDWLRTNGFRTVLHLLPPGESDTADRKVVESHGLRYLGLEVSPQNLAAAVNDFNRIVGDPANLPLFVYDKDGTLAGALWYLHFRTVDRLPDETARRKAAALGLREETRGDAGTLWVAIQDYLRKQSR